MVFGVSLARLLSGVLTSMSSTSAHEKNKRDSSNSDDDADTSGITRRSSQKEQDKIRRGREKIRKVLFTAMVQCVNGLTAILAVFWNMIDQRNSFNHLVFYYVIHALEISITSVIIFSLRPDKSSRRRVVRPSEIETQTSSAAASAVESSSKVASSFPGTTDSGLSSAVETSEATTNEDGTTTSIV